MQCVHIYIYMYVSSIFILSTELIQSFPFIQTITIAHITHRPSYKSVTTPIFMHATRSSPFHSPFSNHPRHLCFINLIYLLTIQYMSYLIRFHHWPLILSNKWSRSCLSTIRLTESFLFWILFFCNHLDTAPENESLIIKKGWKEIPSPQWKGKKR